MALSGRLRDAAQALLAVSTYQKPPVGGPVDLDSSVLDRIRAALGGALQPIPFTKTRWFQADLETAAHAADGGDMTWIGQLWRSMKRDGYIMGLSETRTAGLMGLPKKWYGNASLTKRLQPDAEGRSMFDELIPPTELAQHAADTLVCGVGVGELMPVKGRDFPVFVRLDPEFLRYRWNEQRWYYQSVGGALPITPGDGRWVLTAAGGRVAPWQGGLWPSLGRAFITKEHAMLHRGNYSGKLANPARVVHAPNAATEEQRVGFLSRLLAWGLNTTIELPPGWEASLLESNGRGWEVFKEEIDTSNQEIMIALAGQFVTVTGGTGFANADIHETIRADLIERTGKSVAQTVNTQILPQWAIGEIGLEALNDPPRMMWETDPPADQAVEAKAMKDGAAALRELQAVLASLGVRLDHDEIVRRRGWPVKPGAPIIVAPQGGTEPDGDEPDEKPSEDPTKPKPMIEKRNRSDYEDPPKKERKNV